MCKDAPTPDPLIGEAARANAAVAKEALDFYKGVYQSDILPAQQRDQQLREGIIGDMRAGMRQQQQFADEQNAYYKSTFQPIEQQVARDAMEYDSEANINRRKGIAAASVNQQFSNAQQQSARALSRYGINPNSSAFARENAKLTNAQALASAGAQTGAAFDTMDRGIALRAGAANFGRGMANTAAAYYSGANSAGANAAGVSSGGIGNIVQGAGMVGQGFNTAISGNQSAGNLMLGDFQGRMQGYQADQAAIGGLFQGAGMAFGMTNGFGMFPKRADGGPIEGPGGPRDDKILIAASDGEFVLNEGAVKHFGLAKLHKMNEIGLQNQKSRGLLVRG